MTAPDRAAPPRLADADWLAAPGVGRIFAALDRDGEETRIVGGAVRDALAGRAVGDIDFATTALPDVVAARAEEAGLKPVPTGIEHGTVTVVADGTGYQVTTLREDVETDGRHAVVRFGRDWTKDALRRDFTINALSVDARGAVHDPLGGYGDVVARRVRFIGDAGRRIAEDRLRILRFFRFTAEFGEGPSDPDGLLATIRARDGLRSLSAERVGQEMRRLVLGRRAAETLTLMQDCGVLPVILAGVAYLGPFRRYVAFEEGLGADRSVPLRLAALGCRIVEDADRIAERLRLAHADRDRMRDSVAGTASLAASLDDRSARRRLYAQGVDTFRGATALAFAWAGGDAEAHARLYLLPERWSPPRFPLGGRDALALGLPRGPVVGAVLQAIEAWWIDQDFGPDESTLRARLQQMIAAAQ